MGTPWLYSQELLPLRLRAKGTAVATSVSWLCTFVIEEIKSTLMRSLMARKVKRSVSLETLPWCDSWMSGMMGGLDVKLVTRT